MIYWGRVTSSRHKSPCPLLHRKKLSARLPPGVSSCHNLGAHGSFRGGRSVYAPRCRSALPIKLLVLLLKNSLILSPTGGGTVRGAPISPPPSSPSIVEVDGSKLIRPPAGTNSSETGVPPTVLSTRPCNRCSN